MNEQNGEIRSLQPNIIEINPSKPTISLISACIAENAFFVDTSGINTLIGQRGPEARIELTKLEAILDRYQVAYPIYENKETLVISDNGFDWKKETGKCGRVVLSTLLRSSLLSPAIVRDLIKFAGPSNISVVDEMEDGHFSKLKYQEMLIRTQGKIPSRLPRPESVKERNKYFEINFGKTIAREKAGIIKEAAHGQGFMLGDRDCLQLGIAQIVAHEYGHAIELALHSRGISVMQRALSLPDVAERLFSGVEFDIHEEHFARGIENFIFLRSLQQLGLSTDDANIIKYSSEKEFRETARLYKEVIVQGEEKGISLPNLRKCIVVLEKSLVDRFGEVEGVKRTPKIVEVVAYLDEPYSEGQVRYLVSEIN